MKKICVMGLGYIGLPTAALFAKAGYEVLGVDINENIVNLLNKGEINIEEVGVKDLVNEKVKSGSLRASTAPEPSDIFIIAVPTPIFNNKTANLDYVMTATEMILPLLKKEDIVIVESTIPPRTTEDVIAPLLKEFGWNVGEEIFLAYCPERVLPGKIIQELIENGRVVGGINSMSANKAAEVYRSIVKGEVIETLATSAEMAKLMENTYRDVNIALANELSKVSSQLGINSLEVIELANKHPRVNIHYPGPGVGGHCIAVDPYFIIEKAPNVTPIISQARKVNNSMPSFVVEKIDLILESINNPKIAIVGLTYKGNTDDIRESPALEVTRLLLEKGKYQLSFYDPYVKKDQLKYKLDSFEEAIDQADLIVILSDHKEFKNLDEKLMIERMRNPVIFDTKNCVNVKSDKIEYLNFGNIHHVPMKTKVFI